MAITILPKEPGGEEFANRFNKAFDEGIRRQAGFASALKMQELLSNMRAKQRMPLLEQSGLPREMAQLEPSDFNQFMKYEQSKAASQGMSDLMSSFGGGLPQQMQPGDELQQQMQPGRYEIPQEQTPREQVSSRPKYIDTATLAKKISGLPADRQIQVMNLAEQHNKNIESREVKERGIEIQEHHEIQPFLHQESVQYKSLKQSRDIAEKMLDSLEAIKDKWPSAGIGALPIDFQRVLIRDPKIRKFIADSKSLVSALAGTRKGLPTNFKLKLEELAKADLSMPIETARELLNDVIERFESSKDSQKFIHSQKDKKTGKYPIDIEQRTQDFENAREEPLSYPEYYKVGTVYEDNGDRSELILENGKKTWRKA